jgi:LuxR family maltose regulon positive regulatory protein
VAPALSVHHGRHYVALMQPERLDGAIAEGRRALTRGAWAEARGLFARALAASETPDAYEGLGIAARYELDAEAAIDAHEHGYRLARTHGDADTAARLAIQLSYDAYAFRGPAEASGWVERAAMLIDGQPPSTATAFVPMLRAQLALANHDPEAARAGSEQAIALAREVGAVDVEMLALGLNGLALVSLGEAEEGMRRIDDAAAAAVGGEMTDADSIESVCCFAIDACKRVRDLDRANEWCLRVREIATRFGDRQMFSVCRTHYADVLLWHGDWERADAELTAAVEELGAIQPGREADPLVRIAELRRRQGRTGEAEELLARATSHRLHALVEGLLALDRGNAEVAQDAAARFLRRIAAADRFERVAGLELMVRVGVAGDDIEAARQAAEELAAIAAATPNAPLRAAAALAAGRIAAAHGEDTAAALLEDAADLLESAGAGYEAARARLELSAVLRQAGRDEAASRAESRAQQTLAELGAPAGERPVGGLSPRETEVLKLVARGLSNEDIAHQLVLSVRTVERHVANVYAKIGASGRTARAIATAWAHSHGVT